MCEASMYPRDSPVFPLRVGKREDKLECQGWGLCGFSFSVRGGAKSISGWSLNVNLIF